MATAISAQIKLEGGKAFASDFKNAASAVKSANSELKYLDSELKRNGSSVDGLRNKMTSLNSAVQAEQAVIQTLTNRIQELSQMTGVDTTQAINELTAELNKHKAAENDLQTELQQTATEMERMESGADSAGNEIKDMSDSAKVADAGVDDMAEALAAANVKLELMAQLAVSAAKAVGKWFLETGKEAVEYNANIESSQKTIEAFYKTSGQGAEEAAAGAAELISNQKKLSKQIGMGTDVLIDANKMLIASGVSGEESQDAVSALAKAIVATGGGNEELSRMAQNLQQISNTGKASSMDLKQFAMAGVDVYGLLADSTGKTVEELQNMDITFDMISQALQMATAEGGKFYEASQVGATTLNGQVNTLQSTIKDGLGTAFQPVNEALTNEIIPKLQEFVDTVDWTAFGQGIANALEGAMNVVTGLVTAMQTLGEWIGVSVDYWNQSKESVDAAGQAHFSLQAALSSVEENAAIAEAAVQREADMAAASAGTIETSAEALSRLSSEGFIYGLDFGTGVANGISSSLPAVDGAVASVANAIQAKLHFSRPDEGPLRNYETWMPDMMKGLQKGIDQNMWRIQQASANVAGTLSASQVTYNGGINLTVNGARGQSAQELTDEIMLRIQRATARRQSVWA